MKEPWNRKENRKTECEIPYIYKQTYKPIISGKTFLSSQNISPTL